MSQAAATPTLSICRGKACRKRAGRRQALIDHATALGSVREVRCQKICQGVVAGLPIDGSWTWFRDVKGTKVLNALTALMGTGVLQGPLRKRRVKQRQGKLRE